MLDLGIVKPGKTIRIPINTFDSNDPQASATVTALVAGDVEIYKDGSTTQRASDAGYTVTVDFDTTTGVQLIAIDLADNTTAGFYSSGSEYIVVVGPFTLDAATINAAVARFEIGMPDADLNTTIATLASQTSFTLTAGPAENDALNGCVMYAHDVASSVQGGYAVVSDYVGSTRTVTLTAGPTFTMAATDNVHFYPPSNINWVQATSQTANDNGADINLILADTNELQTNQGNWLTATGFATSAALATAQTDLDTLTGADGVTLASSQPNSLTFADITFSVTGATDNITFNGSGSGDVFAYTRGGTSNLFDAAYSTALQAEVNAACDTALTDYDAATGAEVAALNDISAADVNAQMLDVLQTDTFAELASVPAATSSLKDKITFLFMLARNQVEQTATTQTLRADDTTTAVATASVSDDATTATKGEFS